MIGVFSMAIGWSALIYRLQPNYVPPTGWITQNTNIKLSVRNLGAGIRAYICQGSEFPNLLFAPKKEMAICLLAAPPQNL